MKFKFETKEFVLPFLAAIIISTVAAQNSNAAMGEMGTGYPVQFGTYTGSAPNTAKTRVWRLTRATINIPASCTGLWLSPETMGMDSYKIAVATLLTARVTQKLVRFYAHAERDGGCGADYIEMVE